MYESYVCFEPENHFQPPSVKLWDGRDYCSRCLEARCPGIVEYVQGHPVLMEKARPSFWSLFSMQVLGFASAYFCIIGFPLLEITLPPISLPMINTLLFLSCCLSAFGLLFIFLITFSITLENYMCWPEVKVIDGIITAIRNGCEIKKCPVYLIRWRELILCDIFRCFIPLFSLKRSILLTFPDPYDRVPYVFTFEKVRNRTPYQIWVGLQGDDVKWWRCLLQLNWAARMPRLLPSYICVILYFLPTLAIYVLGSLIKLSEH